MDDFLVLARLLLAAVFVLAGVTKLLDRPGSRRALVDFDVPERVARPMALLLPVAELATGVALVASSTARWAGIAALALLCIFVAGLTRVVRRGDAPDCHCFGQVHSEPATWLTVARNVALSLPAAYLVAGGPGPSLRGWLDGSSGQHLGLVATASLAAVSTTSAVVLWRQNRRLRTTQIPVLPNPVRIGARAPQFSLRLPTGSSISLRDLLAAGRPCVLTFVSAGCVPCQALLPELARWSAALADRLTFAVVSAGDPRLAAELAAEHELPQVLADPDSAVSRAFGVPGTPCAVLVGVDGTVGSAPAPGQIGIEALVRVALDGVEHGPAPVVHQAA